MALMFPCWRAAHQTLCITFHACHATCPAVVSGTSIAHDVVIEVLRTLAAGILTPARAALARETQIMGRRSEREWKLRRMDAFKRRAPH
eukprot:931603-Pyramimonas_sp.AAC.1